MGRIVRPLQPTMRFLFVGPELCLWLPSDSASRQTPLPLASASCYRARSGLSPPSCYPCRAHPAQFALHCRANWKCAVELSHVSQSLHAKSLSELCGQLFGKILDHLFAIGCTVILTTCFMNGFADLPVRFNHCAIDSFINLLLCVDNITTHLLINIFYQRGFIHVRRLIKLLIYFVHSTPPERQLIDALYDLKLFSFIIHERRLKFKRTHHLNIVHTVSPLC